MFLTEEFRKFYHEQFKPLAEKCAYGFKKMVAAERGEEMNDEDVEFKHIKKCVDPHAIWYIGLLIGEIDLALIKGKRLNTINAVSTVNGCLSSSDYWQNVWQEEARSGEEYKNLKELSNLMSTFMSLFAQTEKVDFFKTIESLSESEGAKEFFKNVHTHDSEEK
jgi:hypothetical protein